MLLGKSDALGGVRQSNRKLHVFEIIDHLDGLPPARDQVPKPTTPRLNRLRKPLLLGRQHGLDKRQVFTQFRIDVRHPLVRYLGDLRQERALHVQGQAKPHRPPNHPPQYVTAARVLRHHPIGDQKRRRSAVLRDNPDCAIDLPAVPILLAGKLLHTRDERTHDVRLVNTCDALRRHRRPLEPHAGVDVLARQHRPRPIQMVVELREDQVVQLHEIVGKVRPPGRCVLGGVRSGHQIEISVVIVKLRRRPARPFLSGRAPPVLLIAKPENPLFRYPQIQPYLLGLIVIIVDRRIQPLHRKLQHVPPELQRPQTRLLLEILGKRKVPEHLKKRQMRRVSDLIDIGRPKTLLRRYDTRLRRLRLSRKVRLELCHPGVGQQQSRVGGRNQRRRRQTQMLPLLEMAQKRLSDLIAGNRSRQFVLPTASESHPDARNIMAYTSNERDNPPTRRRPACAS